MPLGLEMSILDWSLKMPMQLPLSMSLYVWNNTHCVCHCHTRCHLSLLLLYLLRTDRHDGKRKDDDLMSDRLFVVFIETSRMNKYSPRSSQWQWRCKK